MESDNRLPTGQWNGFYLESHQPRRGWMHLYLSFEDGKIKGEGTDYVGPWTLDGRYDLDSKKCWWTKNYVGQHDVTYQGQISDQGIAGNWQIGHLSGDFHIWPQGQSHFDEHYLKQDLAEPFEPTIPLGTVPTEDSASQFAQIA